MSSISLVTPTSRRDVELCELQCESVDRYLSCYVKHHLIVPDDEIAFFDRFNAVRRVVVPASQLLPAWLRPMPRLLQHKGQRYWWSLRTRPVSDSHLHRILKIAAADAFPESRHCILDPDVVFFRRFDLSVLLPPRPAPLFEQMDDSDSRGLVQRARTSRQLLGLTIPTSPTIDFNARIAVWDRRATRGMIERIETVTGVEWVEALCHAHHVCEYMLYGRFVQDSPRHRLEHVTSSHARCLRFGLPAPDRATIEAMLRMADASDVACSAAGLTATSVDNLNAVLAVRARGELQLA
jgi:Family of unknown function (DUF6492)